MIRPVPLEALVAQEHRVHEIVAPQYDFIPMGNRYDYAMERPDSFLNITLSQQDFPAPEPTVDQVAQRACQHFARMRERGLYETSPRPAFFLYELAGGGQSQTGVIVGIPVESVDEGRVLGHEGIIEWRAADLVGFYRTARLTSSPVALTFRADDGWRQLLERLAAQPPIRDFTTGDDIRQRLWRIDDPADMAAVEEATGRIDTLYITDGHHRVAASQVEEATPGWLLAALFPAEQMQVMSYNRCVRLNRNADWDHFARRLSHEWEIIELGEVGSVDARPTREGDISVLVAGKWRLLRFCGERPQDPVRSLDVALLHDRILRPVLGINSVDDWRLSLVIGGDATARMENRARNHPRKMGFALHPVLVDRLLEVADAGRLMPAKSTWFTPKPRSGLVVVTW